CLSEEEIVKYLEQILIITYGSEDLARARFEEIASKAKNPIELDFLINEELNTEASNTLLRMFKGENISGLINDFNTIAISHESITTKISNPHFFELLLEKQKEIAELTFQTLYHLPGELSREEMAVAMLPDFYFTKQEIASEFGVDKKTFNKWLEIIFPDKR